MLVKQSKRNFLNIRRGLRFFIIAEGALLFGSYMLYAACNRSQATRKYLYDRPYLRFLLKFYYSTGQLAGNTAVREFDKATWAAQEKLASSESRSA